MDVSRRGFLGGVVGGMVAGGTLPAAAEPGHDRPRLDNRMRSDHAWARFLGEQDLIWKRVPRTWYEGPFLGNGFLGSMVYQEPARNALRFTVHHSQVQDHRPSFGNEWGVARLPVGNLTLEPVGEITGADLRLDLWNAELRGTVTTDRGRLDIRAFIESPDPQWRELGDGTIEIDLARGGDVVIHAAGHRPDLIIAPVRVTEPAPPWGLQPLPPAGQVTQVDLEPHLNNDAITSEFFMGDGDFDGAGSTYPAAALPQTGAITDDEIPFQFINGVEGTKNNVVATGQTIEIPVGRYARLHLLGVSDNGNTDATMNVEYAGGTTSSVPLRLTDWKAGPAFGETEAIRAPQYHTRDGAKDVKVAIFHQVVELDPAQELTTLTLPTLTAPRPHLFAISLEKPA